MILKSHCQKKVLIDTSVILYDALALKTFHKTDIYIPLPVIEEIDRFKRDMGENGRNARQFSRFMDTLRSRGSLTKGVHLEDTKSYVYVSVLSDYKSYLAPQLDSQKTDNQILGMALFLQQQFPNSSLEIISKDINLRVKSDVFGLNSKDYDPDRIASVEDMYSGVRNIKITKDRLDQFFKEGFIVPESKKFLANQYVIMESNKQTVLGRYNKKQNKIIPLISNGTPIWRIHPRNPEQNFAFDALLNPDIFFVSLIGKAGTGKTLLALAAGLYKTMDEGVYKKLLVSRPVFPMGRDIGYLPGDVEQKLNPWMQPVFESLEFIMGMGKKASRLTRDLVDQGLLSIEPLAYIRGRSIPQQYLIVDEAQNLTPHEIKTIITRAGIGTKVVLTGDFYQIDNPYVDASNSGLTYSVEKFKGQEISAHVNLKKGERSELAELGANLL
ncbi:MAG: PhoH family protein [Bdellovibrionaceae bacterium]|nr:PhoH family protein [Pseudobdellovibrionaceae bacterium]